MTHHDQVQRRDDERPESRPVRRGARAPNLTSEFDPQGLPRK
ncbi:hypothetical protein QRX60_42565 [Amycolatopsis mongoliensis]|uniref:Uncharacterized protein n=1 Tax=Amycolatopsis mongoliensis TaxID=715475 RepID=A0A9Y2NK24_9PSEU|nr:hypothetical protein [Amycolatopsis sp. 4-36]WIY00675.1 hypothetical protein QRX60_42565 [Amycolatopsis sp. 4-36]